MKIGIITDIHEDLGGLERAMTLAEDFQCDELACLGDIAGFNPDYYPLPGKRSARECLRLIRENFRWVVAGNHDLFACQAQPSGLLMDLDRNTELQLDEQDSLSLIMAGGWTYEGELPHDLDEDSMEYLRMLPRGLVPDIPGIRCLFSHYVLPDLSGSTTKYVRKRRDLASLRDFMAEHEILLSFVGHTHLSGTGFAFPLRISGAKQILRAVHRLPFQTYPVGNTMLLCLLPAIAARRGNSGFSMLDTEQSLLRVIPLHSRH